MCTIIRVYTRSNIGLKGFYYSTVLYVQFAKLALSIFLTAQFSVLSALLKSGEFSNLGRGGSEKLQKEKGEITYVVFILSTRYR